MPSILTDQIYNEQLQKLYFMRQEIQSKPNTTTVFSRYGPFEGNDDPIPVADFEKICFDFPTKSEEILNDAHYKQYNLSLERTNEVVSLWKAELKCVCENGKRTIHIVPSLDDFCSVISSTISEFYSVVSNFTSLTSQDELVPYITQTKHDLVVNGTDFVSEWPNVTEMQHRNNQYEFTIRNLFSNIFKKLMKLVEVHTCKCISTLVYSNSNENLQIPKNICTLFKVIYVSKY